MDCPDQNFTAQTTKKADVMVPVTKEEQKTPDSLASSDEKQGIVAVTSSACSTSTSRDSDTAKNISLRDLHMTASSLTAGSFGPLTSFFWCPGVIGSNWHYSRLIGKDAPRTISLSTLNKWNVGWPCCVALSPHGAGYFAFSCEAGGGLVWRFVDVPQTMRPKRGKRRRTQFNELVESYAELKSWLIKHVVGAEDIKTTRVVFGPGSRYIAWKPNGPWIGNDLPDGLQQRLTIQIAPEKTLLPWHITFGSGNAWAALWRDGSQVLELDGEYAELEEELLKSSSKTISYILLNGFGELREYIVSFDSVPGYRTRTIPRCQKVVTDGFLAQMRHWSSLRGESLSIFSDGKDGTGTGVRITSPDDADKAVKGLPAIRARESELLAQEVALLAEEAAKLSIESSKKSISASRIAVVAAVAAGCTVM